MRTVTYSMAGAYDYASQVIPENDEIADILEQDSCFYSFNPYDSLAAEKDEMYNDNWCTRLLSGL